MQYVHGWDQFTLGYDRCILLWCERKERLVINPSLKVDFVEFSSRIAYLKIARIKKNLPRRIVEKKCCCYKKEKETRVKILLKIVPKICKTFPNRSRTCCSKFRLRICLEPCSKVYHSVWWHMWHNTSCH